MKIETKNQLRIDALAFIAFLLGTAQNSIAGMLDQIASSLGISLFAAGQLITAFAIANAVGTPLVVLSTTRRDRRCQLLFALFIILCGLVATASLSQMGLLLVGRAILGVGNGFFVVVAYSSAAELAPKGHSAGAMSKIAMGFGSALVFGVPLGRVVATYLSWRMIFWSMAALALLSMVLIFRWFPPLEGEKAPCWGGQRNCLKDRRINGILAASFLSFVGYSSLYSYIVPFLCQVAPPSGHEISSLLFVLGFASLLGPRIGGFLGDRIGLRRTLMGSLLLQVLALSLEPLILKHLFLSVLLLVLWMSARWAFVPVANCTLVKLVPEASEFILGVSNFVIQLGNGVGAFVGGFFIDRWPVGNLAWLSALLVLGGALAVGTLVEPRTRRGSG